MMNLTASSKTASPFIAKIGPALGIFTAAAGFSGNTMADCVLKNPNLGFFSSTAKRTFNFSHTMPDVESIWEKGCKPFIETKLQEWNDHPERSAWDKQIEISMQCTGRAVCDIRMTWDPVENTLTVIKSQGAESVPGLAPRP